MLTESEAVELMRKYAPNEMVFSKVIAHTRKVAEISLRMAENHPGADKNFIKVAALLHDIGRFKAKSSIEHGILGSEIMRREGEPRIALVCERHLGAGIPLSEILAKKLSLPHRDFLPVTIEEKIITAADNLVAGDREISEKAAVERFRKELGEETARRVQALFDELR